MKLETDEIKLEKLYKRMWQALLTKDIETLEEIHAEGFVLEHMTGMRQSKAEYLRCVREEELKYFSEETEKIFVEVKGESGSLIGQSRVNAAVFGGSRHTWRLQLAFEVKKTGGEWLLMKAKASTY